MPRDSKIPTLLDFSKQSSPYYTPKHEEFRRHVAEFVDKKMLPYADKWEKTETIPKDFLKQIYNHGGIFSFPWGYSTWRDHKWDPFYAIIFGEEISRAAINTGAWIHNMSLPPVLYYGKNDIHKRVIKEVSCGDKWLSLAISELRGGSDVANIDTTATKKTINGKEYYVINGNKYWITAGARADYFVTLCRTGGKGYKGLSLILVPRQKGVFSSKIKLQGGNCAGTAQVTFANVTVPVENLIGNENEGFKPLMFGFNNERFIIACGVVGEAIVCVNESIKWARERKTFGKRLIDHQVIKHKIAEMSMRVIAAKSFLERVAFQLKTDRLGSKDPSVSRNMSLLKVCCTRTLQYCTIESSQIFGGRSYVVGGRGGKVERLYRMVRAQAIAGGSEEVMLDFAVRKAKL